MSFISGTGLPPVDPSAPNGAAATNQAQLPASIRDGNTAAKSAYQAALGFEQLLVEQLTTQLAASATGSDASSADGSSGSGGLMGSDPASSMYARLLPSALTSGVMSSGGTGMALALARALDPAIGTAQATAAAQPTATTLPAATTQATAAAQQSGGAAVTAPPSTATGSAAAASTGGAAITPPPSLGANGTASTTDNQSTESSNTSKHSGEGED
jgi:hypothetical protein